MEEILKLAQDFADFEQIGKTVSLVRIEPHHKRFIIHFDDGTSTIPFGRTERELRQLLADQKINN